MQFALIDMAKALRREIANGATSLEFTTTEVGAMGSMDMAYEYGTIDILQ